MAALNLIAGQRAKALDRVCLGPEISQGWPIAIKRRRLGNDDYDLIFAIECLTAECELLTAEMVAAEKRLTMLSQRAKTRHDFAVVTRLQLTLYTTLDRSELAIEVFLDYLRRERDGLVAPSYPRRRDGRI